MWADAPGGWTYEWSRLARRYAGERRHGLAVPAYGNAKFPTLANPPMRRALAHQAEQYQRAAPAFPVAFERRILTVPHQGSTVQVPIHLLAAPNLPADAPVTIVSGGVDTWKMDLHRLFVGLALRTRTRILAFDLADTGETSHVPMTHDGGTEIIDGLIAQARTIGNGQVAHFGLSMGGHYSATTGLTGSVDAAVDLGGPVEAAFTPDRSFAHGMEGIVGNALGYDAIPTPGQVAAQLSAFTLRPLLDQDANAPMLVSSSRESCWPTSTSHRTCGSGTTEHPTSIGLPTRCRL